MDPYMYLIWIPYGSYMNPYMDLYMDLIWILIWIQVWILYGDLGSSFVKFMLSISYKIVIWRVASLHLRPAG